MLPGLGSCPQRRSRERPDLQAVLLDLGSPSFTDLKDQESKGGRQMQRLPLSPALSQDSPGRVSGKNLMLLLLGDVGSGAAGPHQPPHYRELEKDSENIGTSTGKGENGKRSTGGQKIFIGIEREQEQGRENTLKTTV
ncbi:hypothetical protein Q7C36_023544 [Tachysurus vachellii]|uniref:Uncharacterized protein n=1 Tax=Tachysurus vachellii TaxID=175792 RepID=A0AA88LFJ0_TACVA|nr:hypothetical protein Q7C36_023544 [Tachysurus vachellii]